MNSTRCAALCPFNLSAVWHLIFRKMKIVRHSLVSIVYCVVAVCVSALLLQPLPSPLPCLSHCCCSGYCCCCCCHCVALVWSTNEKTFPKLIKLTQFSGKRWPGLRQSGRTFISSYLTLSQAQIMLYIRSEYKRREILFVSFKYTWIMASERRAR